MLGLDITLPSNNKTAEQHFVLSLFTLLGTISLIAVFTCFVDQKKLVSVGFNKGFILKDIWIGVLTGVIIMLAGFVLLVLSRQIHIDSIDYSFKNTLLVFGTFVCVGVSEELLFRGYVLNNLMVSFNKYIALVISSIIFCIAHFANPDINTIGIIALLLAGLFLGLCYILTKNLWLPVALHFSWNFFQTLLGFNVSGGDSYSIVTTSFVHENIWNGGNFGFEGSVLSLIFQALAMVVIFCWFKNRLSALDTKLAINSDQLDL